MHTMPGMLQNMHPERMMTAKTVTLLSFSRKQRMGFCPFRKEVLVAEEFTNSLTQPGALIAMVGVEVFTHT